MVCVIQMVLKDGYQGPFKLCGNFAFTKRVGAGPPLLEEKKTLIYISVKVG